MTATTVAAAPLAPAMPSPPPRLSVAEFLTRYADVPNAELVDGFVKEQPMTSPRHGKVCARMTIFIGNHVEANDLGHVMSNDSRVQTGPDSVRGGDVLFFSYERLPRGEVPEGLLPVAPDLVVEVKSPNDTWVELFTKVVEYLKAGVRVVVVIDPSKSTVSVYRGDDQEVLRSDDTLTLPDVLPGFSLPVARLFA